MKKQDDLWAFGKALWDEPINKLLTVLDIVGLVGAALIVIDDLSEAVSTLLFVAVLLANNYLIFRKQRRTITRLQHALTDTSPDVVPMPIETPSSGQPFSLRIRNEGKSPARNVSIRMNYKDRIFSAKRGSLKPDETISLDLQATLIGPIASKARVRRMMTSDQMVVMNCEFSCPSSFTYLTQWECEWGAEWTFKKKEWSPSPIGRVIVNGSRHNENVDNGS